MKTFHFSIPKRVKFQAGSASGIVGLTGIVCVTRTAFDGMSRADNVLYVVKESTGVSIYFSTQTEAAVHPSVACTKAEYDAMETHDPYTVYHIIDG